MTSYLPGAYIVGRVRTKRDEILSACARQSYVALAIGPLALNGGLINRGAKWNVSWKVLWELIICKWKRDSAGKEKLTLLKQPRTQI